MEVDLSSNGDGTTTVSWVASEDDRADGYIIRSHDDELIGLSLAAGDGSVLVDDALLGPEITVHAVNDFGLSEGVTIGLDRWEFSGFRPPVADPPTVNATQAGRTIPVRFSLGGDRGLDVFAHGSPVVIQIPCGDGSTSEEVTETAASSRSGLSYAAGADQYTYTWVTDRSWADGGAPVGDRRGQRSDVLERSLERPTGPRTVRSRSSRPSAAGQVAPCSLAREADSPPRPRQEDRLMGQDEITGANFRVYRPAPGYVRCDHPDGAEVSGEDARDVMHAIATLADGGPTPLLVDLRGTRSASREARKTFRASQVPSKVAMYVDSPLSRTLANFFIGVARPDVPTKVFTDLDEAEGWLLDDG